MDIRRLGDALLFLKAPGRTGVGTAVRMVGVEIPFGNDQNLAGLIDRAFVQNAVVEFKRFETFYCFIQFTKAGQCPLCFKEKMDVPVAAGFGAALIDETSTGFFGLFRVDVV